MVHHVPVTHPRPPRAPAAVGPVSERRSVWCVSLSAQLEGRAGVGVLCLSAPPSQHEGGDADQSRPPWDHLRKPTREILHIGQSDSHRHTWTHWWPLTLLPVSHTATLEHSWIFTLFSSIFAPQTSVCKMNFIYRWQVDTSSEPQAVILAPPLITKIAAYVRISASTSVFFADEIIL